MPIIKTNKITSLGSRKSYSTRSDSALHTKPQPAGRQSINRSVISDSDLKQLSDLKLELELELGRVLGLGLGL